MSKLEQTIRFVIGTALVAAGVTAAAPYVSQVVAAHVRARQEAAEHVGPIVGDPFVTTQVPPHGQASSAFAAHAIPDPLPGGFEPHASGFPEPYPQPAGSTAAGRERFFAFGAGARRGWGMVAAWRRSRFA